MFVVADTLEALLFFFCSERQRDAWALEALCSMLRRRNLLTTLLIALPWALLLTLWHQYPTTRYLSLLRSKCKSSPVSVLVAVMIAGAKLQ